MQNLQQQIKDFVVRVWGSTNIDRFPGPQPISIERKHFSTLKRNKYFVCEKLDGIRHILVCFKVDGVKICALVNRSFEYKLYSLTVHKDTLLDGELVGSNFIVHDAVCINGESIIKNTLETRLAKISALCSVIIPGNIRVCVKKMKPLEEISSIPQNKDTDGLIFTPNDEPVRLGTHRTMFKWKTNHTVDFIVMKGFLCVQENGSVVQIQKAPDNTCDGEILECVFESVWRPILRRQDKNHPNNLRTLQRTEVNIKENITFTELCNEFSKNRTSDF